MALTSSTLRPGLLVALRTTVKGNVRYFKTVIASESEDEAGEAVSRWETERRIADAKEQKLASQVRSKARSLISGVCAASDFGLLCPQDREEKLEAAIAEAKKLAEDFNAKAKFTTIGIYAFTGRVAADDVEAVKAINSEVRDLLSLMEGGIKQLDVKAVRAAADKARDISQVLSPDAQSRISDAIEVARSAARKIVKAGAQAAVAVDEEVTRAITRARASFLDLDQFAEVQAPEETGRAVDFVQDPDVQAWEDQQRAQAREQAAQTGYSAPQIEI